MRNITLPNMTEMISNQRLSNYYVFSYEYNNHFTYYNFRNSSNCVKFKYFSPKILHILLKNACMWRYVFH